jgi:hypothetical protein
LNASVAAIRAVKARAKTRQGLEQALSRFVKDNEPVRQTTYTPSSESEVPVTSSTISPGTHPFAAEMLRRLAQENSPDVAVDEFIKRAEKRLGTAQ